MMRKTLLLLAVAAIACQAAPSSDDVLIDKLYTNVRLGDYASAVADTINLVNNGKGGLVSTAVKMLIYSKQRNLMTYAYFVYQESADIIKDLFPLEFRMIFEGSIVKLIYKMDNLAMKLGVKVDSDGDRTAYGDKEDKTSERVSWTFKPLLDNQKVYFLIVSAQLGEYLKSGIKTDSDGDHTIYSSHNFDSNRHQWYLIPVYHEGELLFFIYNREYNQALKLGRRVDSDGDRPVYSNNGDVSGRPDIFGWVIKPF